MSNTQDTGKAVAKRNTVKVIEGEQGLPVGVEQAAERLKAGAGILRDVLAERVSIIGEYVAANSGIAKSKAFDALLEAIDGGADVPGNALSSASLYRYATIYGLITGHGLPVTAVTVKAAYGLTEGKRGAALKAVQGAKASSVKTPEAFAATVERAITASAKASASVAPAAPAANVGAKRQTVAAWRKSLSEYVESAPEDDREAIRKGLTAVLATLPALTPAK